MGKVIVFFWKSRPTEYELCLMSDKFEYNKFYVEEKGTSLRYVVINPSGLKKEGLINEQQLKKMGLLELPLTNRSSIFEQWSTKDLKSFSFKESQSTGISVHDAKENQGLLNLDELRPYFPEILEFAFKQGHTRRIIGKTGLSAAERAKYPRISIGILGAQDVMLDYISLAPHFLEHKRPFSDYVEVKEDSPLNLKTPLLSRRGAVPFDYVHQQPQNYSSVSGCLPFDNKQTDRPMRFVTAKEELGFSEIDLPQPDLSVTLELDTRSIEEAIRWLREESIESVPLWRNQSEKRLNSATIVAILLKLGGIGHQLDTSGFEEKHAFIVRSFLSIEIANNPAGFFHFAEKLNKYLTPLMVFALAANAGQDARYHRRNIKKNFLPRILKPALPVLRCARQNPISFTLASFLFLGSSLVILMYFVSKNTYDIFYNDKNCRDASLWISIPSLLYVLFLLGTRFLVGRLLDYNEDDTFKEVIKELSNEEKELQLRQHSDRLQDEKLINGGSRSCSDFWCSSFTSKIKKNQSIVDRLSVKSKRMEEKVPPQLYATSTLT